MANSHQSCSKCFHFCLSHFYFNLNKILNLKPILNRLNYKVDAVIVLTLRIFFSNLIYPQQTNLHSFFMSLSHLLLVWISLLHSVISHILIPPFLPDGYQREYYEQKFRISQLDTANFKISGLPKDIFWTSNGTIFGTPSNFGQWTINIAYDTLTQSGNYQTILVIKRPNVKRDTTMNNGQQSRPLEIIFPESLIFEKNSQQQIEFLVKNAIEPVEWKFTTLPKGVIQSQNGKLSVKVEKEGIYILRLQVMDDSYNQIQACVTLNVQTSKSLFIQSYAPTTIYQPSQNVNRLLEITKKETEIIKQLTQAAIKLGEQGKVLKDNEEIFRKVSNNLIQLQNQAKYVSNLIETTIRDKRSQEQRLKEAFEILKNSQESLNLALIQQISNNNLLKDSSIQKAKAQLTYDKAAKDLENQILVLKNVENKLIEKQQQKQSNLALVNQTKNKYSQLGEQIVSKQKQLTLINQSVAKTAQQVVKFDSNAKAQNANLTQQENKYVAIESSLKLADSKIQGIQGEIQDLMTQRAKITDQIVGLDSRLKNIETNDLFNLQRDIQYNDFAIQTLLFDAIKEWNSIQYNSAFIMDYLAQVKFGGCSQSQYPSIQGLFSVKQIFSSGSFLETDSGHRILYGKCTQIDALRVGQQILVSGYTAQGVIHADKIVQR